jgi:sugar fermentation stimulation protein A
MSEIVMIKKPARLIRIENVKECSIIERLNRFVVTIAIDGIDYPAHITNTGRLSEFMIEGQKAFCFRTYHQGKTNFRLFAIEESGFGALIDTWLQMKAFEQALERNVIPWLVGCLMLKRNVLLGASRIDYLLECDGKEVYLEVKSAVLRAGAYAMYPDCPSERGRKHIHELADLVQNGGEGILLFMAALPHVTTFKPNRAADEKLYEALKEAHAVGVAVRAMGLYYNPTNAGVYLANPDLEINLA